MSSGVRGDRRNACLSRSNRSKVSAPHALEKLKSCRGSLKAFWRINVGADAEEAALVLSPAKLVLVKFVKAVKPPFLNHGSGIVYSPLFLGQLVISDRWKHGLAKLVRHLSWFIYVFHQEESNLPVFGL